MKITNILKLTCIALSISLQVGQSVLAQGEPDVRSAMDQHGREIGVAVPRRPVERRHAVALGRVHIGALFEQRADGGDVAAHGGVGDRRGRHGSS